MTDPSIPDPVLDEAALITAAAAQPAPITRARLVADLRALGLAAGDLVVVHSSLRALGWVLGGAQTVVEALLAVLGPTGTLAVPTHSSDLSDPGLWQNPPIPAAWVEVARAEMPAFDPHLTGTRGMGRIADTARAHPAAVRSRHPTVSFAAVGPLAEAITRAHPLDEGLGEDSPCARIAARGGKVLLLGVGWDSCTALHVAEAAAEWPNKAVHTRPNFAPIAVEGARRRVHYTELLSDDWDDFPAVGAAFERAQPDQVVVGDVGLGTARLGDVASLVAFATTWFARHRT